jgi:hypothetical protein
MHALAPTAHMRYDEGSRTKQGSMMKTDVPLKRLTRLCAADLLTLVGRRNVETLKR